ncbi:hypothetical protein LEP1GSC188_3569 [Leptospira weilii serovar Topaz str. LT2116]|uniref:Uncharacterized protein n=1 Tax=Leptospira weilii serovar Topaz str. LT2116 TaxID=1088540 RepID=M3EJ40_9LEPT|nr:hypothetical protein LEP1GSC188_3569 [Leptospira weilii serovar Topaz str. LT2116]
MEFEFCKSILKIRNYNKPQFYEQILSHFLIPNSLYLFSKKLQRSAEILIRSNGFGTRSYYTTWKDIYN